jgi:hypothetical protein
MTAPYDQYKNAKEWTIVEKAITGLVDNKDLDLTTTIEHVVGHIVKQLCDNKVDTDLRTKILFSANRAMWGAVTPDLRAVTVDYNKDWLTLRAYFDKNASDNDKKLVDVALTETMADLWQDVKQCRYEPLDLPFPATMNILRDWIYIRHENWQGINVT